MPVNGWFYDGLFRPGDSEQKASEQKVSEQTVSEQITTEPCDRACLEGFVEQYLDAAIAHDPGLLPLAPNVKFTENGVRLPLPDAHWKIMTGKGKYRLFVTDPEAGQVACIATIREEGPTEEGVHSQFAIRLKVVNRLITEIETLVVRPAMPMGPPGATPAPGSPMERIFTKRWESLIRCIWKRYLLKRECRVKSLLESQTCISQVLKRTTAWVSILSRMTAYV